MFARDFMISRDTAIDRNGSVRRYLVGPGFLGPLQSSAAVAVIKASRIERHSPAFCVSG